MKSLNQDNVETKQDFMLSQDLGFKFVKTWALNLLRLEVWNCQEFFTVETFFLNYLDQECQSSLNWDNVETKQDLHA